MKYTIIASGVSLQTAIEFVRKSTNNKKFGIKRTDWDINNVYLYTDVNEKSCVRLPIHYFDSKWQIVELCEEKINTKEEYDVDKIKKDNINRVHTCTCEGGCSNHKDDIPKYDNKNNDNKKYYDCGGSPECKKKCLKECHTNKKDNIDDVLYLNNMTDLLLLLL